MSKGKILIYGFGISGVSAAKTLTAQGMDFCVVDRMNPEKLREIANANGLPDFKTIDYNHLAFYDFDTIIKSPGIKLDDLLLNEAKENGVRIITDIEYAFGMRNDIFSIGITGTNGKTTTTTLLGEMLRRHSKNSLVTGNIGSGIMWDFYNADKNAIAAIELSSFQLQSIIDFKVNIAVVTNITPDHIEWHGNLDNYIKSKLNIFKNQTKQDKCIINYNDRILREKENWLNGDVYYFSIKTADIKGIFIKDNKIYINVREPEYLCDTTTVFMPGNHNLENALAASLAAYLTGVDKSLIIDTLRTFKGVEHRLEFVRQIGGIKFYNDSKGTNTDATIKAIESFSQPINLILGGYEKGEDFTRLMKYLSPRVRSVSVMGQTKYRIIEAMKSIGFHNYYVAENLKEAVLKCIENAKKDDIVLLSPACASWGMYQNYMERGNEFKAIIKEMGDGDGDGE
ncbi:MAG: UDP-N-acetylmuramoylalanine--D-glutamate ligase [Clostridiales bacterium 38_11]|nr:MAG: UDP-N-acetylmuramoylalanine--D-glutamate ligase [Clostridiales bacterium 38_11]HBH12177.1 UDP-N-acetylmuramoyl-L-alanine--D-glutamate ligase [Clostridiales bacterium]